jgi:hypothetical protein
LKSHDSEILFTTKKKVKIGHLFIGAFGLGWVLRFNDPMRTIDKNVAQKQFWKTSIGNQICANFLSRKKQKRVTLLDPRRVVIFFGPGTLARKGTFGSSFPDSGVD